MKEFDDRKIDVSIVIVSYNTCNVLRDCLRSVEEKTQGVGYEVVVVDNASKDGSQEMVQEEFPWVKLVASLENLGFGRANNLGVKESRGEYVYFLNSDTLLVNDAVSILYNFMRVSESVGVCGGAMFDKDMRPCLTVVRQHRPWDFHLVLLTPLVDMNKVNTHFHYAEGPRKVDCIIGANMMIKRDLFDEVGGFDPDFFLYWEEVELINRVKRLGRSVFIVPEARIIHLEGQSTRPVKEQLYRERLYSQWLYIWKAYGRWSVRSVYFTHALKCAVARVVYGLAGVSAKQEYWRKRHEALRVTYLRFNDLLRSRK